MGRYKHGLRRKNVIYPCTTCHNPMKSGRSKLCRKCYLKILRVQKKKEAKIRIGKKGYNFKHGKTLIKIYCIDCLKQLSKFAYYYNIKRCTSCSCKHKLKDPKNHPNYIEGLNRTYPLEFNKELKLKIRTRDNFECKNCDMTEEEHITVYGRVLDIHHIDYDKQNCNKNNLISLCQSCNIRANFNRNYWKEYYKEKIYELQ